MSDAEVLMWKHLRSRKFEGYKFRRQHPIGGYIADFCCVERRLVIELDGGQHTEEENERKDMVRTEYLVQSNYRVIRFWNNDVLNNTRVVLEQILESLEMSPSPRPSPSIEGEGDERKKSGISSGRKA